MEREHLRKASFPWTWTGDVFKSCTFVRFHSDRVGVSQVGRFQKNLYVAPLQWRWSVGIFEKLFYSATSTKIRAFSKTSFLCVFLKGRAFPISMEMSWHTFKNLHFPGETENGSESFCFCRVSGGRRPREASPGSASPDNVSKLPNRKCSHFLCLS